MWWRARSELWFSQQGRLVKQFPKALHEAPAKAGDILGETSSRAGDYEPRKDSSARLCCNEAEGYAIWPRTQCW